MTKKQVSDYKPCADVDEQEPFDLAEVRTPVESPRRLDAANEDVGPLSTIHESQSTNKMHQSYDEYSAKQGKLMDGKEKRIAQPHRTESKKVPKLESTD